MIYHAIFPILDATPERVLRRQAMDQLTEMTRYVRIVGPWEWRKNGQWLIASAPATGLENIPEARRYAQMIHGLLPEESFALATMIDDAEHSARCAEFKDAA